MTKQEQTDEVKVKLYKLTEMFTRAYQPRYYYQYTGDIKDLASNFYCDFLTPKGRHEKKETLLDKYDSNITSLEYLVKVSVIRKLIDKSRQDSVKVYSYDKLCEDLGDSFSLSINVYVDEEIEPDILKSLSKLLKDKDEKVVNKLYIDLYQEDSEYTKYFSPIFHYISGHPVQQITDKTVVLYVKDVNKCVEFSMEDGHPRGNYVNFYINTSGCKKYHSGFSKELMERYFSK